MRPSPSLATGVLAIGTVGSFLLYTRAWRDLSSGSWADILAFGLPVALALCGMAYMCGHSILCGGGLRRGRVERNNITVGAGESRLLGPVDVQRREGVEVWIPWADGPTERLTAKLSLVASQGEGVREGQAGSEISVDLKRAAKPAKSFRLSRASPEESGGFMAWQPQSARSVILIPAGGAGPYLLRVRVLSEESGQVSLRVKWCRTIVLAKW
jgi:hypothetical protein